MKGIVVTEPANNPTEDALSEELNRRPDPYFKRLTTQQAEAVGLKLISAELPQTLTADLVLEIPAGVNLENTLFDFLTGYDYAVLDFKSQNDRLDLPKLAINVARTALFYSRHSDSPPERVLNLIVSSRYPQEILTQAGTALTTTPQRRWLWQGGAFYQPLAIVVCRDLPLEPMFDEWLTFFPADNNDWPKIIRELLKHGRRDLVEIMRNIHPKEYRDMQISDVLKEYPPKERARMLRDLVELVNDDLQRLAADEPEAYKEVVNKMPGDKLAEALDPQQVENLAEALNPQQLEKLIQSLDTDKLAESLSAEQLEAMLQRKRAN